MSGDIEQVPQEQERQKREGGIELFLSNLNEIPQKHIYVDKKGKLLDGYEDLVRVTYGEKENEFELMRQESKLFFRIKEDERVEAERNRTHAFFSHGGPDNEEEPAGTVKEQLEEIVTEFGTPIRIACLRVSYERGQSRKSFGGEFLFSEISEDLGY